MILCLRLVRKQGASMRSGHDGDLRGVTSFVTVGCLDQPVRNYRLLFILTKGSGVRMLTFSSQAMITRERVRFLVITSAAAVLLFMGAACGSGGNANTTSINTVTVPKLVGKQEAAAKAQLKRLGLKAEIIWQGHSPAKPPPPRSVVAQQPAIGSRLRQGRTVTLIVYL